VQTVTHPTSSTSLTYYVFIHHQVLHHSDSTVNYLVLKELQPIRDAHVASHLSDSEWCTTASTSDDYTKCVGESAAIHYPAPPCSQAQLWHTAQPHSCGRGTHPYSPHTCIHSHIHSYM